MRLLFLVFTLVLLAACPALAQVLEREPKDEPTPQEYLYKSQHQRRTANVMLLMGGGLALTSAVGIASAFQNSNSNPSYLGWERTMLASLGVALVSVPLYVAANHNQRKAGAAVSLQLGVQPGTQLATAGLRLTL